MKKDRILEVIGDLPDDFVEEALTYEKNRKRWIHPWIVAACMVILLLTGIPQYTARAVVAEVRQIEILTMEEAQNLQPLGSYFPSVLPDGYAWTQDGIQYQRSGVDVLTGTCYNSVLDDTLTITVSAQSYFGVQTWGIEEPVRNGEQFGSQIFMDLGDFAVHYHSSNTRLSDMEEFEEMHYSAAVHKPGSGGFRMVTSKMYDPIDEHSVLLHLSLNAEDMTVSQTIYPLSYPLTGTYFLQDHSIVVEMTDNNWGTYRFTYTVITRDLLVLKEMEFDEKAAYGEWIEAHVPLEAVLYRNDLWSDANKKEDQ